MKPPFSGSLQSLSVIVHQARLQYRPGEQTPCSDRRQNGLYTVVFRCVLGPAGLPAEDIERIEVISGPAVGRKRCRWCDQHHHQRFQRHTGAGDSTQHLRKDSLPVLVVIALNIRSSPGVTLVRPWREPSCIRVLSPLLPTAGIVSPGPSPAAPALL